MPMIHPIVTTRSNANLNNMQTYAIGKLSTLTEVKPETIRYFEKIGLLSEAGRQSNGYRLYDEMHLRQLRFIQRCRKLGFSQQEIKGLVNVFEHANDHTRAEVKAITTAHLDDIREKIQELEKLESALSELTQQCDGDHETASECPILASLANNN